MAHDYAPHDFNHDLYSDILWRNSQGDVAVWSIRDNALVTGLFLERAPANEHIVSSGDLNGDLTFHNSGAIPIRVISTTGWSTIPLSRSGAYRQSRHRVDGHRPRGRPVQYRCLSGHPVQHAGGQLHIWNLTADGRGGVTIGASGNVGDNPGPAWHPRRVGDYNGDGHNDVFWQHDNGSLAVWSLNDRQKLEGYSLPARHELAPGCHGRLQRRRHRRHLLAQRQRREQSLDFQPHGRPLHRGQLRQPGRNGFISAGYTMPIIMPTSCGATARTAASPSGTCRARSSLAPSFSAP